MKFGLIVLLGLAGCSSMSETFDSVPGKGVGAKPITIVNHMVDQGQLKGSALQEQNVHQGQGTLPEQNALSEQTGHQRSAAQFIAPSSSIERCPEKTMKVWFAPYIDEQGHLHEASRVHTVICPSSWPLRGSPLRGSVLANSKE